MGDLDVTREDAKFGGKRWSRDFGVGRCFNRYLRHLVSTRECSACGPAPIKSTPGQSTQVQRACAAPDFASLRCITQSGAARRGTITCSTTIHRAALPGVDINDRSHKII